MTDKESRSFQIKTILLTVGITIAANIVLSAFGYYREDTQSFDRKLETKVNVVDYNEDKKVLDERLSKNESKWESLIKITTESQTDIKWLREKEERRGK